MRTRLTQVAASALAAGRAAIGGRDRAEPGMPPDRAFADPFGFETISSFLAREARLLDDRRWDEWLALWTDTLEYALPTRTAPQPDGPGRRLVDELGGSDDVWWFHDDRHTLTMRIAKLQTGKAWAEEPPGRTRRFVTNLEIERDAAGAGGVAGATVRSNVLVHRGRRDHEVEWFSCGRTDRIVADDGALRLASRHAVLDANVVAADNFVLFV